MERDLPIAKPCIHAEDECYNVEWSTELTVPEAYDEYIRGLVFYFHVLMKELNLSEERDFMFNMSVGYDLEGINLLKLMITYRRNEKCIHYKKFEGMQRNITF